jgi:hypothetical protein
MAALHPVPQFAVQTKLYALVVLTLGTQMVVHSWSIAVDSIVITIANIHVTPIVVQMSSGVGAGMMRLAVNCQLHVCVMTQKLVALHPAL